MDSVADDRPNAIAAHLAGRVGDDPVVEHHSEPAVRENLVATPSIVSSSSFGKDAASSFAEMPIAGGSWLAGVKDGESAIARKTVDVGWQREPDSRVGSQKIRRYDSPSQISPLRKS